MSYYPRGQSRNDKVDDFDDYDPTPYGGGYDINLTYGRPLSASHNTCYPPSTSTSSQGRPAGYGGSCPSAYNIGHGSHDHDELTTHSSPVHRLHVVGGPAGYRRVGGHVDDDHDEGGYRRKNESEEHDNPTRYGNHGKPSYKKHDDDDDDHDRPRYGRKKQEDDDDSSDEDEKKHRRRGRQHKSYDDE